MWLNFSGSFSAGSGSLLDYHSHTGNTWTREEKLIVLRAAAAIDRQLRIDGLLSGYVSGAAFHKYYGSYEVRRSSKTRTFGAETFDNKIEFYDYAFTADPFELKFRNNVVHEFGHAFNGETVSATDGTVNPYNDLTVALGNGGALNGLGRREGMEGEGWQQSPNYNTANELFADYFLNWIYGHFLNNDAGNAQFEWMTSQMATWLQR